MREKIKRNQKILQRIEKGDYQVDIANHYGISEAMVSKIKKRYSKAEEPNQNINQNQ
jgi:DNA-binding CsgD family transcriptional regulator